MKVTFLGTGTSLGIPVIGCGCEVCRSDDPRDKRLRTSAFIETEDHKIIIDTGPDFRYQMLRAGITRLDAVLITHPHRDHLAGLDDVRTFNYLQKMPMPVYGNDLSIEEIKCQYHYVFDNDYPGVPQFDIHIIENKPFEIDGLRITPIEVMHYTMRVFGFRVTDFTYITDANNISDEEMEKIYGSRVLVLNALQKGSHVSHFTLEQALEVIEKVKPEKAYLTHISHRLGLYGEISKELPENVALAYDGLTLSI